MPSGVDAFRRKVQRKEEQKAQFESSSPSGGMGADLFSIKANQYAIVRFLEQGEDITFADVHRIPIPKKAGGFWFKDFVCLDTMDDGTPCPACQSGNEDVRKRSTRGFVNLIWREGPVYQKDEKGYQVKAPGGGYVITGRADAVFLWKCSWTVLEMLREKDGKWQGLMSRDAEVKRTGSTMQDTAYFVEPQQIDAGAQPMLVADLALAENKYDVRAMTTPLSYAELAHVITHGAESTGPQPTMDRGALIQQPPTAQEAFSAGQTPSVQAGDFQRASVFQRG